MRAVVDACHCCVRAIVRVHAGGVRGAARARPLRATPARAVRRAVRYRRPAVCAAPRCGSMHALLNNLCFSLPPSLPPSLSLSLSRSLMNKRCTPYLRCRNAHVRSLVVLQCAHGDFLASLQRARARRTRSAMARLGLSDPSSEAPRHCT